MTSSSLPGHRRDTSSYRQDLRVRCLPHMGVPSDIPCGISRSGAASSCSRWRSLAQGGQGCSICGGGSPYLPDMRCLLCGTCDLSAYHPVSVPHAARTTICGPCSGVVRVRVGTSRIRHVPLPLSTSNIHSLADGRAF